MTRSSFVTAVTGGMLDGKRFADVLREPLRVGVMRRDRREGLEVHHEPFGGPFGPELGLFLGGECVVGGVVLDDREALGVVAEPFVGVVLHAFGIPAGFD